MDCALTLLYTPKYGRLCTVRLIHLPLATSRCTYVQLCTVHIQVKSRI